MTPWGYHLLLDCGGLNSNITSSEEIKKFIVDLVNRINMQAVGDPVIEHLLPNTDNSGYSVFQMIQTSNITAHFTDKQFTGYIDVFSCKEFDPEIVIEVVKQYFNPDKINTRFLTRQA